MSVNIYQNGALKKVAGNLDPAGYATESWVGQQGFLTSHQDISGLQTKSITDTGGYYTTDTVEGALQEIGSTLDGIETLLAAI